MLSRSLPRIAAAYVVTFAILMPWSISGPDACPTTSLTWPCPMSCESLLDVPVPCGTGGLALAFATALVVGAVLWYAAEPADNDHMDSVR